MKPDPASRLRQQQQENIAPGLAQNTAAQSSQAEFATPEDLLRHDSQAHPVPPELAHRLNQSLAAEPRPAKSWLRRFFE